MVGAFCLYVRMRDGDLPLPFGHGVGVIPGQSGRLLLDRLVASSNRPMGLEVWMLSQHIVDQRPRGVDL